MDNFFFSFWSVLFLARIFLSQTNWTECEVNLGGFSLHPQPFSCTPIITFFSLINFTFLWWLKIMKRKFTTLPVLFFLSLLQPAPPTFLPRSVFFTLFVSSQYFSSLPLVSVSFIQALVVLVSLWFKLPPVVQVVPGVTDVDIHFRHLSCRYRHPFRNYIFFFVLRMSTSASDSCVADVDIRFVFFFVFWYYGCRHPLQTIALRMSTSVSYFFLCIMNVNIRFRQLRCRCRHPFRIFFFWYYGTSASYTHILNLNFVGPPSQNYHFLHFPHLPPHTLSNPILHLNHQTRFFNLILNNMVVVLRPFWK